MGYKLREGWSPSITRFWCQVWDAALVLLLAVCLGIFCCLFCLSSPRASVVGGSAGAVEKPSVGRVAFL